MIEVVVGMRCRLFSDSKASSPSSVEPTVSVQVNPRVLFAMLQEYSHTLCVCRGRGGGGGGGGG